MSTPGNRRPLLPRADRTTTGENTHAEQAKALIRRWFGEAMNSGSSATARAVSAEVFAEGFVDHDGPGGTRDRAHWQSAVVDAVFAAFSDVEVRIEHLLAERQHNLRRLCQTGPATPPAATTAALHGRGAASPPGLLGDAYHACSLSAGQPVCGDVAHVGGRTVTFRARSVSCV